MYDHCNVRPTVTFPATEHHLHLSGTKLYCLVTEACVCVNNLLRVVPSKWNGWESNIRHVDLKSNTLTITPLRLINNMIFILLYFCVLLYAFAALLCFIDYIVLPFCVTKNDDHDDDFAIGFLKSCIRLEFETLYAMSTLYMVDMSTLVHDTLHFLAGKSLVIYCQCMCNAGL